MAASGCNMVEVNTDKLRSDTNEMNVILEKMKSSVDDMFSAVEHLNTMWEGSANTVFNEKFGSSYDDIKSYFSSVKKFLENITADCSSYDECERSVSELVESMQI